MPAEVGQIHAQRETAGEQILLLVHLIRLVFYVHRRHLTPPSSQPRDTAFRECAVRNRRGNAGERSATVRRRRAPAHKTYCPAGETSPATRAFRYRRAAPCLLPS